MIRAGRLAGEIENPSLMRFGAFGQIVLSDEIDDHGQREDTLLTRFSQHMAVQGSFFGLPLSTLQALQSQYVTAVAQLSTIGKSYTVGNRSYSLADLPEMRQTLLELGAAIRKATGCRRKNVVAVQAYRDPVNPVANWY